MQILVSVVFILARDTATTTDHHTHAIGVVSDSRKPSPPPTHVITKRAERFSPPPIIKGEKRLGTRDYYRGWLAEVYFYCVYDYANWSALSFVLYRK